jgi:DNA (cytosine-5)-methyltransferase 3A
MSKLNVLSLFDGMSCGQIALDKLGIEYDYYSSEIDNPAMSITLKNFPKTRFLGNVEQVKYDNGYLIGSQGTVWNTDIDLLIAGSPCQDLSGLKSDGKGLNGEKSKLFFEFVRLLKQTKPKYFLLENVVPRKKEWKEEIDRILGVKGVYINSDLFVPQNRPRIYWTNIPINELPDRPNWNKKYYQFRRTYFRENKSGVCPCLTANMGTGGHNVPLKSMDLKDKLSPNEVELLQGVPLDYTSSVSNSQRYKMIGNGWTVDVITHIFKNLTTHTENEPPITNASV